MKDIKLFNIDKKLINILIKKEIFKGYTKSSRRCTKRNQHLNSIIFSTFYYPPYHTLKTRNQHLFNYFFPFPTTPTTTHFLKSIYQHLFYFFSISHYKLFQINVETTFSKAHKMINIYLL